MEITVKEQFVKVGILYNAFDSTDVQKAELLYQKDNTLADYLVGLPTEVEWQVGVNGMPVKKEDYAKTEIFHDDYISVVMIPQGGGAKDILRIVAMVALVVAAVYFLGPAGMGGLALLGTGIGATAAMAAVLVAGTLLINALLPPTIPKSDVEQGTNYGYDGAKNTAREGVPIPVVYGNFRVAGNYVDVFTENQGDEQYLYGRTVLSDGEIDSVTNIELNEQPIGNFQSVESGITLGTNTETENTYFGRSIASQPKGSVLNTSYTLHTTTTPVDAVQFNVSFPTGIVKFNDKGKKLNHSVPIEYAYKLVGSGTWTTITQTFRDKDTKTLRRTIEVSLPRGTYDLRIRRTTADATDSQTYDDVSLVEVNEIQASNVALRSVATGWYKIKMTDQLNGVPRITWKVKGVKVKQYNSAGALVTKAWSNNPAWIVLDMLIGDERGAFKDTIGIDWQAFYDWAQYCETNQFYFNGVFDETTALWDALAKVYKVGRAMPTRIGTTLSVAVDKPTTPVMMFGAGNIEKDTFKISYLPLNERANEFEVSFYDEADGNKKKSIRIIDPDAEARGDIPRAAQYELFGVDNHTQAQKEVWYQLYQNRLIKKTVSFRAPIESIGLTLGDVALIQHDMVDWGISGRIKAGISTTQVTLDKKVTLDDGDTLMVIFDQVAGEYDVIEERTVTAVDSSTNTVTVSAPFSQVPQAQHNYMFGLASSVARPFRLRSISGDDLHSRELSFVEYNDFIYSAPEQTVPATQPRLPLNVTPQVNNLAFIDAVDYADTTEKDVISTVGWTTGHIRKYAGADIYLGTIAKEDYLAGTTTPDYKLVQSVNNVKEVKVVAEYGDYVFVKVVAFDVNGVRASYSSAPSIFALVEDPITLPAPTIATDGSAIAYTTSVTASQISFEFDYSGLAADIDGFYVDVEYSETSGFTSSQTERFILNKNQRAIVLGNIDAGSYYNFSVMSYKQVHDIFNPDGLVTSTAATHATYHPGSNTAYSGDILETVTSSIPYVDFLDFIHFNPNTVVEEPALGTLSRPTGIIPTDESGDSPLLTETSTIITVKQGTTELAYNGLGTTAGTWRISSVGATNCVAGAITDTGTTASVANLASITGGTAVKSAKLDFVIQGKTTGGVDFTLTLTQSFSKIIGALIDSTPPSVPTGLNLTYSVTPEPINGVPKINGLVTWTASPETDTFGYIVAIKEGTGNFVEFTVSTNSFQFTAMPNVAYTVKVKAFDKYNNVSAFSSTSGATSTPDAAAPSAPTGLSATASFKNIFLQWTNPSASDLKTIKIWENTTNNPTTAYNLAQVNAMPSITGTFTRSGLNTGITAYYWVSAIDTSGNESAKSAVASATTATVVNTDIGDTSLTAEKFASGIKPVEVLSTLPTTGNVAGRMVFLTTDAKLYRYNGSAFVATVPTSDLTGQITTTQITDDSISTAKLQANSVTTNKLLVKPSGLTINSDPGIADPSLWSGSGNTHVSDSDFYGGKAWETQSTTTSPLVISERQPFDPNKAYRASISGKSYGAGRNAYLGIIFYDAAGVEINTGGSGWGAIGSYHYWGLVSQTPANTLTKYSITFSGVAGQQAIAPSNARYFALLAYTGYLGSGNAANYNRFGSFLLQEIIPAELIVDGAITTNKLAANSITAGKIQAGAIGADAIAANSIGASKLLVSSSNLIPNGDLATGGFAGWKIWYQNASLIDVFPINDGVFRNCVRIRHNTTPGGSAEASVFAAERAYSDTGASEDGFVVEAGRTYRTSISAFKGSGFTGNIEVIAYFWKSDGTYTTSINVISGLNQTTLATSWQNFSADFVAPAGALRCWIYIYTTITDGAVYYTNLRCNLKYGGNLIVDGGITTNHMTANSISGDRITAGTLNADKIVAGTITGDRFNTGTSLPGTITVGSTGVSIGTVTSYANDPADRINNFSTNILPGKIIISGSTTLASWRNGTDDTKIEGGSIAANTITANKVSIGVRGITIEGLEFEANRTTVGGSVVNNNLAWSAGTVSYINDGGTTTSQAISAGAQAWSSGVIYIYWQKGATVLYATTSAAAANAQDCVVLATYRGGNDLVANYGRTIIDGAKITTGTISATKLNVSTVDAITANLGTITAGTIRNNTDDFRIDVSNGRTIAKTGSYMKVTGAPFGSTSQFIEWYGPYNANLSTCTEANAVYYLSTNGNAYFGGTLSAGILKNAVRSTMLNSTASVETGDYNSNGNTIQVVLSYSWKGILNKTYPATTDGVNQYNADVATFGGSGSPSTYENTIVESQSVSVALDRSVNSGAFANATNLNISSGSLHYTGTKPIVGDSAGSAVITQTYGGSLTYTDPSTSTALRNYKATITSRTFSPLTSSQEQLISIVSTE